MGTRNEPCLLRLNQQRPSTVSMKSSTVRLSPSCICNAEQQLRLQASTTRLKLLNLNSQISLREFTLEFEPALAIVPRQ